jgi:hypothetical protein
LPSTWATGRGGFALGIGAVAVWILFTLARAIHRKRTLAALTPVLATPRSPLANAGGVVELSVRARRREDGVRALIGDDVVAYSEVKISERYQRGKNTALVERGVHRAVDELDVVDESGDGRIDLRRSILDVELRKLTLKDLSPRYAERGIVPERHPNHVAYVVEERVIRDGDPLYVFGDVSDIALRANEGGYRAVRGAPTLGGTDVAPVLVYAGDERSLVATLTAEARVAHGMAVLAGLASVALTASLAYLASL